MGRLLSVVWVRMTTSSYSLCFALCCVGPGPVVLDGVSPVLSPDSVALVSSLSPVVLGGASWPVAPAGAERQPSYYSTCSQSLTLILT